MLPWLVWCKITQHMTTLIKVKAGHHTNEKELIRIAARMASPQKSSSLVVTFCHYFPILDVHLCSFEISPLSLHFNLGLLQLLLLPLSSVFHAFFVNHSSLILWMCSAIRSLFPTTFILLYVIICIIYKFYLIVHMVIHVRAPKSLALMGVSWSLILYLCYIYTLTNYLDLYVRTYLFS